MRSHIERRELLKTAWVGSAAIVAGCLSGVGGGGGTVSLWESGIPDEEELPEWHEWLEEKVNELADEEFNYSLEDQNYDDIRQNYLTGAEEGEPAVIEDLSPTISEYVSADLLEPLNDRAEELDWFDGYRDTAISALTFGDELIGLPLYTNTRGLVYRQDILDELGYDVPEDAESWLEIGSEISNEYDDMWGFVHTTQEGDIRTFQEFLSYSYQFADNLYKYEDDSWSLQVSADDLGQVLKTFYHDPYFAYDPPVINPELRNVGYQVHDLSYISGNAAMCQAGQWIGYGAQSEELSEGEQEEATKNYENSAMNHLPSAPDGGRGAYSEVKAVMLNPHTELKDEAFTLMAAIASPEARQKEIELGETSEKSVPVHNDVTSVLETQEGGERWMKGLEVYETASSVAFIKWGGPRDAIYTAIQNVIYDEKDPWTAGEDLHERLKDLEDEV